MKHHVHSVPCSFWLAKKVPSNPISLFTCWYYCPPDLIFTCQYKGHTCRVYSTASFLPTSPIIQSLITKPGSHPCYLATTLYHGGKYLCKTSLCLSWKKFNKFALYTETIVATVTYCFVTKSLSHKLFFWTKSLTHSSESFSVHNMILLNLGHWYLWNPLHSTFSIMIEIHQLYIVSNKREINF